MKKYDKIVRHGQKGSHLTVEGNPMIVVTEKLDGANASFQLVDGEVKCYSRNNELSEENNLRGFYQWVKASIHPDDLETDCIYFGEWLVKHTINYPSEAYQKFYLFDVYDVNAEKYLSHDIVDKLGKDLELYFAPVLYKGPFQGYDHLKSLVGTSKIGDVGEGIVIKNYTYKDKHGDQLFTKIVSDSFAEEKKVKKQKLPSGASELDDFVDTFLTKARIEKMLNKLVDEGVLEEDYGIEDMGIILKNSGRRIIDDILEEELDSLVNIVKKKIGKSYPNKLKELIG